MTIEKDTLRVLAKLEYGVYVVSMGKGAEGNAFTASWVSQVASQPATVVVSINNKHQSARILKESDCFVVNLLGKGAEGVAKAYYGPAESGYKKLDGVNLKEAPATGCPIIPGGVGYLDCKVVKRVPVGNHTVFFGEILAAELESDAEILTSSASKMRYLG
jgi:flavin reductase (DIM6/NTAB) family NADH-FMN oxidoreductase RutF